MTLKDLLPDVLEAVSGAAGEQKGLKAIIAEVLTGEERFDLRRACERIFNRKVTAQEGRSGAQLLARSLIKQIDHFCEAEANGLTYSERGVIVQQLAENAALELVAAADALLRYPACAIAVCEAKAKEDVPAISAGRRARTIAADKIKNSLLNVARKVGGDDYQ